MWLWQIAVCQMRGSLADHAFGFRRALPADRDAPTRGAGALVAVLSARGEKMEKELPFAILKCAFFLVLRLSPFSMYYPGWGSGLQPCLSLQSALMIWEASRASCFLHSALQVAPPAAGPSPRYYLQDWAQLQHALVCDGPEEQQGQASLPGALAISPNCTAVFVCRANGRFCVPEGCCRKGESLFMMSLLLMRSPLSHDAELAHGRD